MPQSRLDRHRPILISTLLITNQLYKVSPMLVPAALCLPYFLALIGHALVA